MDYGLLGPLEVTRPGVGPIKIEGVKTRALLVLLLLSRNNVVSVDRIAETLFSSLIMVGIALLVTAGLLLGTRGKDGVADTAGSLEAMTWSRAVLIGVVQGVAIIPGISRSGATIAAALYLGVDRDLAGRFSFLLSIPAILGALLLSLTAGMSGTLPPAVIVAGMIVSAVVGYLSLRVLMPMIRRGRLYYFAPYCALVGIGAILWGVSG